jgi:hypothetical protein
MWPQKTQPTSLEPINQPVKRSQIVRPVEEAKPDVHPKLIISEQRKQELLGGRLTTPISDPAVKHTLHFVIRILKSWARSAAAGHVDQLPPIIHKAQLLNGTPIPLSNCFALTKMWFYNNTGSRKLVENTILQEVQRLIREVGVFFHP